MKQKLRYVLNHWCWGTLIWCGAVWAVCDQILRVIYRARYGI